MALEDDDKIAAEGSSPEGTTDVPANSSIADAGATATDSPAVESTKTEPAVPAKPEKTARETLIAKLTGAEEDDTDEPEEATESDKPEAVAKSEEGAETPAKAGESTDPATPDVLSDEELVAPVDKHTKPQTRKRIEALIADRKAKVDEIQSIKPLAEYGQSILKLCSDNGLTAEDFGQWFAFGTAINKDPRNAPALLMAEAERIARNVNVQLPKAAPDPTALQDLEDLVVEGVTSMELSGDTAKKLLDKIRSARKAAPHNVVPPPPPVVQQQAQTQTQNPPAQQTNPAPAPDPAFNAAKQEMGVLVEKYAKAHPADWPKILEVAQKGMLKYGGADVRFYPKFFEQEVEKAKAQLVVPRKPLISQTLRPTTTSAAKPIPTGKAALLAELTGKGA